MGKVCNLEIVSCLGLTWLNALKVLNAQYLLFGTWYLVLGALYFMLTAQCLVLVLFQKPKHSHLHMPPIKPKVN